MVDFLHRTVSWLARSHNNLTNWLTSALLGDVSTQTAPLADSVKKPSLPHQTHHPQLLMRSNDVRLCKVRRQLWACSLGHETASCYALSKKRSSQISDIKMFHVLFKHSQHLYVPIIFFGDRSETWISATFSSPIIWGPQLESPQQPTVRARRVQRPETPNSIGPWRSRCRATDLKDMLRVPYWWINLDVVCFLQVPWHFRKTPQEKP